MKILFYAKRNLHLPHLEPIRQWFVKHHPEVECVYSSPPYSPSLEGFPGQGLTTEQISGLVSTGVNWIPEASINSWKPEVTVLADADFGGISWGGKIVNVNHGLISKGTFYTHSPVVQREHGADLICVPGPYHYEILKDVIHRKIVVTGLVKFDSYFRREMTKASTRAALGIEGLEKVVLFAPTYNIELSAIPVVTDKIRRITENSAHLLIKLHGMSPPAWRELYKLLSLVDEHIHYIQDTDLTTGLIAADVVISDVSSAFMEAMAIDRPVVLVNNPLQTLFAHYDPCDIEYAWRDVGLQANTVEEMLAAVKRSLRFPEEKAALRRHYGPQLIGSGDGKAAERIGKAILAM